MAEITKKKDTSVPERPKDHGQSQTASERPFPGETIGSLMAECGELTQQIHDETDRLERFMLETGGASDTSDRIQENIDSLKKTLSSAESRLQALLDEQEKEAFAPEGKAMEKPEKTSVRKKLAEKKAEVAMIKSPQKEKERKPHGMEK